MARRTAEQDAKKRAKGATLVALNGLRTEQEQSPDSTEFDLRLKAIAKEIRSTQAAAVTRIGKLIVEAREIFRYRRNEHGFGGWVESQLPFSRHTAYNLLHVYERFGEQLSNKFDTLAPTVLYLLAQPSTPESACTEILDRAAAGENVSVVAVKAAIAEHRQAEEPVGDAGAGDHDGDAHDIGHDGDHVGDRGHGGDDAGDQNVEPTPRDPSSPPSPPPAPKTSKTPKVAKRSILQVWGSDSSEDRQIIRDLVARRVLRGGHRRGHPASYPVRSARRHTA
jgi:hypothetical protein